MKLKLKTATLQEMVSKAIKGASMNKMAPLTSLMGISLDSGLLSITTTDGNNKLQVLEDKVEGKDFAVTVQVELFSKLVAKTTTEKISLKLEDNNLEFKGNGKYTIELPVDEEGDLIEYPTIPYGEFEKIKGHVTELSSIKAIITSNKAAVAETLEIPALTGYMFGSSVITTDTFKVCNTDINVLNEPILLPAELVELLGVLTEEKITVKINEEEVLFETGNIVVYGYSMEDFDEYPLDAIKTYLETEFASSCSFPKQALIDTLDRVNLFVSSYDKSGVYLTFTKKGLDITTKQSNGAETLVYASSKKFKAFTCQANIELLRSQLVAQPQETVTLWYGHEMALKITSGKITQVVALLQDDREDSDDGTE